MKKNRGAHQVDVSEKSIFSSVEPFNEIVFRFFDIKRNKNFTQFVT